MTDYTIEVTVEPNEYGNWTVWTSYPKAGTDRPEGLGISVRTQANVDRLVSAIEAGVVFTDHEVRTDIAGKTFVHAKCNVMGKYLNADLKRLGY